MKSNCLWYALDKLVAEGGRLCEVHSMHWCIFHVQHMAIGATHPTQFVPHGPLRWPWLGLFGFDGHIVVGDPHEKDRVAMHPLCIGLSLFVFAISGAVWLLWRTISKVFK